MSGTGLPTFHAVSALLLAAGRSSRMGQSKCLLPWGQTTILGHLVAQWRRLGAVQIVAVHAAGDLQVASELDRLNVPSSDCVVNPDASRGMFSSIQCAAQWPGWRGRVAHRAIILGDQPHLSAATLRRLIAFSAENMDKICQPVQGGHARHPVILPPAIFEQLACARVETLKEFLAINAGVVARCQIDDPGLELDLDYPADYEAAREKYWPRRPEL